MRGDASPFLGPHNAYDVGWIKRFPLTAGLGLSTQLALAVAAGATTSWVAIRPTGRWSAGSGVAPRSGVGIGLFDRGGLVVEWWTREAYSPPRRSSATCFPALARVWC